jgi:integrase
MEGLKRKLAKPKVKKEPVTIDMLSAMVGSLSSSPSLSEIRLLAISLLAYAAFLRYDEISSLRCCDITFSSRSMSVRINSSKTDQYRQGDSVLVAWTDSALCPVSMLERYFHIASIVHTSRLPLFRGIVHSKNGEHLRAAGGLSYTRMRELFLKKIAELGFDPKPFGLHSLRAGGATAAANAGVPDRLFKRHGRWRSESAKDGYVKDSLASLWSVSRQLVL